MVKQSSTSSLGQTSTDPSSVARRPRGRPALAKKKVVDSDAEIMDSDDITLDDDGPSNLSHGLSPSGSKILKAVAIPTTRFRKLPQRGQAAPSHNPSTASSMLSSDQEESNEDETPFTSAAVTPAEFSVDGRKISVLTGKTNRGLLSGKALQCQETPSVLSGKGKRKRNIEEEIAEQVMDDALLAQSLQEQEHAMSEAQPTKPEKRGRKSKILDSEDDFDDSMEISSQLNANPSSRTSSIQHDREKVKRVKTVGSTSLPSRAARDSARKSIAEKASMAILDSDDDEISELSDYDSDLDSELEYSDLDDDDDDVVNPIDLAAAAEITAAPGTLPLTVRRRRRYGGPTSTASPRRSREQWLTTRVSTYISLQDVSFTNAL